MNEIIERVGCPIGPVIQYELNEVPWEVIDWYLKIRPDSQIASLLKNSISLTTVTQDEGELSPWSTWPTMHRGVYNSKHNILFLNQDLTCAEKWPPIWEVLAKKGFSVGVFGSLQSYPVPKNMTFSFYVPDTFSPTPETHPAKYEPFQRINLKRTKEDGGAISRISFDKNDFFDFFKLKFIGVSISTYLSIVKQLLFEVCNPYYKTRRAILQSPISFDIFFDAIKKHHIDFSTYFTNHVAGIMHRYWKYAFPEDFNYRLTTQEDFFHKNSFLLAMDTADKQIGILKKHVDKKNGQLIILSSMGQESIDRGRYFGEVMIKDINAFFRQIGFLKPFKQHLAMYPDYNFEFESEEDLEDFCEKIKQLKNVCGKEIFKNLRFKGLTINFGLFVSDQSKEAKKIILKGRSSREETDFSSLGLELIHRDIGTGYHHPKGILIWYKKGMIPHLRRSEIESASVFSMIIDLFNCKDR